MSAVTTTDPHGGVRIRAVVRDGFDRAFRARVAVAIGRFSEDATRVLTLRREQFDISAERWLDLCESPQNAASREEFQAFAGALCVNARWLAIGSGPIVNDSVTGWTPPPPGWFTFGTHVDEPEVELEFSDEVDPADGLPRFERPRTTVTA